VCEHIGHPVIKLQRTHFAGLSLTGLPLGACRFLSTKEIKSLKKFIMNDPAPTKPRRKKRV
jgi:16S rRNA U516 pseudouridylate synthase RsuA-like enzyme